MKKWLWLLLVTALFVGVVATHSEEARRLAAAAAQGRWEFLLAALGLELVYLWNQAALYASITRLTGTPLSTARLFLPVLSANFMNITTPSGNIAGAYVIVREACRQGMSHAEALLLNVFYFVLDYAAFVVVLLFGLIHLHLAARLSAAQLGVAAFFTGAVVVGIALSTLALHSPDRAVYWMRRIGWSGLNALSRFRRAGPETVEGITSWLGSLEKSVYLVRENRRKLLLPLGYGFLVQLVSVLLLRVLFLAYGQHVPYGVLVAGYSVGTLFTIVSITPAGLGAVEASMAWAFSSLGVDAELSVIVTFVYRGISFWLPFFAGFLTEIPAALRRAREARAGNEQAAGG